MRSILQRQLPLVAAPIEHEHARELETIGTILDENPEIARLVYRDLMRGNVDPEVGRPGLSGEQVLRALVVKQMNGFSYETLAFHLADSRTYRAFCWIGEFDKPPVATTLQENLSRLTAETLEAIHLVILRFAKADGIEEGRKVRFDCTVTDSNIHDPMESSLLWDVVRVLCRKLEQARLHFGIPSGDRRRRAKRRALGILNAKTEKRRVDLYRDLLHVTAEVVRSAAHAARLLSEWDGVEGDPIEAWVLAHELDKYAKLGERVIDQTRRRVLGKEKVPASEKIVSIFEPHTDIIVKDRRGVQYGHKLSLAVGASSLVLDCVIEEGNPADSTLAQKLVHRQKEIYGRAPRQVAFDGGFASRENLAAIKAEGVEDVLFSKRRGMRLLDMVKSSWVYRRLWRFRAGVEGVISFLKRCFGLGRCTWKGLPHFRAYVWASVLSANLLVLARHRLALQE
jgi:IS5 family transposase